MSNMSSSSFDDEQDNINTEPENTQILENDEPVIEEEDEEEEEEEEEEEMMFKKISNTIKESTSSRLIEKHHDLKNHNEEEIRQLTTIVRNNDGDIVDSLHKTNPIMTKYEKTRIIGQRCRQLQNGAVPLVELSQYDDEILDDHFIAKLELEQQKLPFIIRRPLPNGSSEYWKITDLEMI